MSKQTCSTKSVYAHSDDYVCNPVSKRWLSTKGPTYKKLVSNNVLTPSPIMKKFTEKICKQPVKIGKFCNPLTGRTIKISSQTYKQLVKGNVVRTDHKPLNIDVKPFNVDVNVYKPESDPFENPESTFVASTPKAGFKLDLGELKFGAGQPQPQAYEASKYQEVKMLGAGNYGTVYSVKDKSNGYMYVLKKIPKESNSIEVIQNEISILKLLKDKCDPYILCYVNFMEDAQYYYIVTEYLGDYVTLSEYLSDGDPITDAGSLQTIIDNLINGLKAIHDLQIAHRDIKPDNIMINPNTLDIKFIDFGVSCHLCVTNKIIGTLYYIAPEYISEDLIEGQLKGGKLSNFKQWAEADIWSLGLTIVQLATARPVVETCLNKYIEKDDEKNYDKFVTLQYFQNVEQEMEFKQVKLDKLFKQYLLEQYKTKGVSDCIQTLITPQLPSRIRAIIEKYTNRMLKLDPNARQL